MQWTPTILLEDNDPSVNDPSQDITNNVLDDGSGALLVQINENVK